MNPLPTTGNANPGRAAFIRQTVWSSTDMIAMVAMILMSASSAWAANPIATPDSDATFLQSFLSHVDSLDAAAKRREQIKNTIQQYDDSITDAVTEGLIQIYPQYADAVESSDADESETAVKLLTPLADSKDQYLAADATFFLARTLMNAQQYEQAIVHLKKLSGELADFSAHRGPSLYFTGLAENGLLLHQDAITSFTRFLRESPDSPERMRVSAWRQLQELQSVKDGKLEDIYRRMDYSRRRLEIAKTDQSTQTQQQKVVDMLNKLIKEEQKKEASSKSSASKKPQPKSKPDQQAQKPKTPPPSQQSKNPKGGTSSTPNGQAVVKTYDDSPASPWSRLRDRSRDPANNAVKEKLPARYRDIVERYMEAANGQGK
jgi:tetratricopeptide (TPR) repeat protein